ncbi:MAG: hypothetical protein JOZ78_13400 [Chroococcidiopsidaceae cyanobacterium CP_BM_ER_R8_30]|nr:hypothetical protein [Chroococcidiopsidaceae cyanobacterium CP_BM_ER_R8_30]
MVGGKEQINVRLDHKLAMELKSWARRNNRTLTEAFEAAARLLISGQIEVESVQANVAQSEETKLLASELASLRKSMINQFELLENELMILQAEVVEIKKPSLPQLRKRGQPYLQMA